MPLLERTKGLIREAAARFGYTILESQILERWQRDVESEKRLLTAANCSLLGELEHQRRNGEVSRRNGEY